MTQGIFCTTNVLASQQALGQPLVHDYDSHSYVRMFLVSMALASTILYVVTWMIEQDQENAGCHKVSTQ